LEEEPFNLGKYRCRVIYYQKPGTPIILLHGYSFTSDVWVDINLLEALEQNGIPYAAIDMPYGARSVCSPKNRSVD
jgi:pimeloyl-ACP methyl ester carboxylesterase